MSKKKKRHPIEMPLPPLPPPRAQQGVILRMLADVLRFVADRLADLARQRE